MQNPAPTFSVLKVMLAAGALALGGAALAVGAVARNTDPARPPDRGESAWPGGWEVTPLGEKGDYLLEYQRDRGGMLHGPVPPGADFQRDSKVSPQFLLSPLGNKGYSLILVNLTPDFPLTVEKDGEKGPVYGAIYDLQFSPDGNHWAYAATDRWDWRRPTVDKDGTVRVAPQQSLRGQWWVVVDGQAGPVQPCVIPKTLTFSPDGQRLAYAVQNTERSAAVMLDGEAGPAFDAILADSLTFSPDGKRFAYAARKGKLWYLVADGKVGDQGYERIEKVVFSPDGARVALAAVEKGEHKVVADGVALKGLSTILELKFSGDSKHVQYLSRDKSGISAFWDGKASPEAEDIAQPGLIVSPDGKRLVYARRIGSNWQVIEGGKGSPDYTGLAFDARRPAERGEHDPYNNGAPRLRGAPVVFSPDSQHLAYAGRRAMRSSIILDGVPQTAYAGALNPVFSSTGSLAYIAQEATGAFVVVDGRPGPKFEHVQPGTLKFSPDGRHLAYIIQQGRMVNVCVSGVLGVPVTNIVAGPEWRADGRVEYVTREPMDGVVKFSRVVAMPVAADAASSPQR